MNRAMLIYPVNTNRDQGSRISSGNYRLAEGNSFARILDASVGKGKSAEEPSEKAAVAAEILRLEMMRSAVTLTDTDQEPATSSISNALKTVLTNYVESSQKTDAGLPEPPQSEEIQNFTVSAISPSYVDDLPVNTQVTSRFDGIIKTAAKRYGVQEGLIKAVIKMESNFNPTAVSRAGAQGLMQLMPGTAAGLGVKNSFDPEQNIMAGTRFLRDLLDKYGKDLDSALAAYNWGPGNVDRNRGAFLPRETKEYLVKVKKYYAQFIG
jgi:soluble lytic murein transglycosylase-like protein